MAQAFPEAFDTVFIYMPPGKIRKLFESWKASNPASHLRPIAEAFAWQERAWNVKGSGCYAETPSEARKAFNALLDRAATRSCSHVRISRSGHLCLYGHRCVSLRSLLMLPSWTSHCGLLSTRAQEDFQSTKVSTGERGTPY